MERKPQVGDIYRVIRTSAGIPATNHLLRATRIGDGLVYGRYLSQNDGTYGYIYEGSDSTPIYVHDNCVEWI